MLDKYEIQEKVITFLYKQIVDEIKVTGDSGILDSVLYRYTDINTNEIMEMYPKLFTSIKT